jgi:transcriptional regulator with XRE-family HTH domain
MKIDTTRMKRARLEAGLSLRALAKKTGLAHTTVLSIESGKREPFPATVKTVADAIGVTVAELMIWDEGDADAKRPAA